HLKYYYAGLTQITDRSLEILPHAVAGTRRPVRMQGRHRCGCRVPCSPAAAAGSPPQRTAGSDPGGHASIPRARTRGVFNLILVAETQKRQRENLRVLFL